MARRKSEGEKPKPPKPPKPPKTSKATVRRRTAKQEDEIEPEDMEDVGENDDREDHDVEIEIEVDNGDDEWPRGTTRAKAKFDTMDKLFGADGPFGRDGPFGPQGPFGAQGPFGPQGFFGPGGLFGNKNARRPRDTFERAPDGFVRMKKRRRMFGSGELRLVLLAMLAEEPRHGYELIKALEEMTEGAYSPSPGVIYPTLQMLNDEAVIAVEESDDARKLYQATDAGLEELADRAEEVTELWERLGRRAQGAKPKASADLFRSLGNLATVLTNKAAKGGMSNVDKDQIIDLIDGLARKIERL